MMLSKIYTKISTHISTALSDSKTLVYKELSLILKY